MMADLQVAAPHFLHMLVICHPGTTQGHTHTPSAHIPAQTLSQLTTSHTQRVMPRTATRQCSLHNTVVSPVFLNLYGGTDQRDGQMGLVLLREAMQTDVLLHLIIALAAFKPNQLHASLDFFSELHKEPFILQQRRKPLHAPSSSSQFQQFPS